MIDYNQNTEFDKLPGSLTSEFEIDPLNVNDVIMYFEDGDQQDSIDS